MNEDVMMLIVSLYAFVAIALFVISFTFNNAKVGARLALGSPVWPIFIVIGWVLLVRSLWSMAEFGDNDERSV